MMRHKPGSLESRLSAYGSMSLALAAVAVPAAALGQMNTYSADLTTGANQPVYFDPATGYAGLTAGSSDFELVTQSFGDGVYKANVLVSPASALFPNGNQFAASASLLGGASSAARLSPGANIGPLLKFSSVAGTLASNSAAGFGHWNSLPVNDDLGLLQTQGCAASACYGWANITVNADYTITLNSFGYDSSGVDGPAGSATPEPSSVVLLALGAAGIGAWRRKKAPAAK